MKKIYEKYISRWEKKKRKKLGDRKFLEKYSVNDKFYIKQGRYTYPIFAVAFLMIGIIRYKLYLENGESLNLISAITFSVCGLIWVLYAIFGYKVSFDYIEAKYESWKLELNELNNNQIDTEALD
ncbi:MAG: hypothetical protein Q7I99_05160 [Acholeplasmataceae bacterium]|nr:hypothetical protein [Acholeplasmataceae bacterium]